jgi:hypothetical protein
MTFTENQYAISVSFIVSPSSLLSVVKPKNAPHRPAPRCPIAIGIRNPLCSVIAAVFNNINYIYIYIYIYWFNLFDHKLVLVPRRRSILFLTKKLVPLRLSSWIIWVEDNCFLLAKLYSQNPGNFLCSQNLCSWKQRKAIPCSRNCARIFLYIVCS